MSRLPIPPLFIAAVVALGVVTIVFQIVTLYLPGGVILLLKEGGDTISIRIELVIGQRASIFLPLGYGKFVLEPNTTDWYYAIDTARTPIVAVRYPFSGVVKVNIDGVDYYLCNESNAGAIVVNPLGWVGDWVKVGSYYVLSPRNLTDNPGYVSCASKIPPLLGRATVAIGNPRADYFQYVPPSTVYVYYDLVYSNGTIQYKAIYKTATITWSQLTPGTVAGTYKMTSDRNYIVYTGLIYLYFNGTATTKITARPTT
jgi:hypothetical protein